MYRVELKAAFISWLLKSFSTKVPNVPCGVESRVGNQPVGVQTVVPNVPCGVERFEISDENLPKRWVPNVPCGVESDITVRSPYPLGLFLMYRVELKVLSSLKRRQGISVPNVPCGVERASNPPGSLSLL